MIVSSEPNRPEPTETPEPLMNPYVRPADSQPLSRRTVFINAGVAAAALAGLTSCTNYGAKQTGSPSAGGGTSSGGASGSASGGASGAGSAITAKAADIPVGGGKIFVNVDLDQHAVITQPTEGDFKAFTSICTHARCDVAEVTTTIDCRCHGSKFSITDGSVVNPPAPSPLEAKTIKVDGDTITVT